MAIYRSMRGKPVDMGKLIGQNETTPAVGNMKVNARGDLLGPGGKVIKKREDMVSEYYNNNPKARVQTVKVQEDIPEVITPPAPVAVKPEAPPKSVPAVKPQQPKEE